MKSYIFLLYALLIILPRFIELRKMIVKKVEHCDKNYNYPFKLYVKHKVISDMVHIDANITLPVPFGNNLKYNSTLYVARKKGDEFLKIFQLKGIDTCMASNQYLGQLWYDIQRAVRIVQVGNCPIPKGQYFIRDHILDLNRMTFQTIPTGFLKAVFILRNVKSNSLVGCIETLVEVQ